MASTRRQFLYHSAAAFVASSFDKVRADESPVIGGLSQLQESLAAAGFNSSSPNSALMAVIGDVHINCNPDNKYFIDHFDDPLVAEINALSPAITDLAIAGDLICYLSDSVGASRFPHGYAWALAEYRIAKQQIKRFRPDMRFYAVPGNHDTDKIEEDAETWRAELGIPPYQKQVIGGVPVFFLNSGHAGMPNRSQLDWFYAEASRIPPDQEVVVVAHHPSFFYLFVEIGLKRAVYNAFKKHRATVWVVGGHGHAFHEGMYVSPHGTRFVQTEVTFGHPYQRTYGNKPGYVLLALQDGKVIHRSFRYVPDTGFQIRKPVSKLPSAPLHIPYDSIPHPAAVFEEGFYDRSKNLTTFVGTDLKSHLIWCRNYTVRTALGTAKGKVSEFLLAAEINTGTPTPICQFSSSGAEGTWIPSPFPTPNYQQVYRVPIPASLRNVENLHIRVLSQLQGNYDGNLINGWGLAADPDKLTAYDKWICRHYQMLVPDPRSAANTRPDGSTLTNIEHFAYNIPLPLGVSAATVEAQQPGVVISGKPSFSKTFRDVLDYRFARRKSGTQSVVTYIVEESSDMTQWTPVDEQTLGITPLNSSWEEVKYRKSTDGRTQWFVRTRIETQSGSTTIHAGDANKDGVDDLLQYAFDLSPQRGGLPRYDATRLQNPAGIPTMTKQVQRVSRMVYTRPAGSVDSGVTCQVEQSVNLRDWKVLKQDTLRETVLQTNGEWEEVECIIMDQDLKTAFYRVNVIVNA